MRHKLLVLTLLATVGIAAFPAPGQAAQATWEEELREMGYLIFHLSNINVINGLNLTREQATRLCTLALQVEAVADPSPTFHAQLGPEMEGVRKTYLEAREVLLKGEPVSPELQARVGQARAAETQFIRSTLRPSPTSPGTNCLACHTAPHAEGSGAGPMSPSPAIRKTVGLAHIEGPYGKRALPKVVSLSPQIESILTDAQKAILGSFSCCLIPPQDLSDPVRAGQAETGEKQIELLRKVRQIPANLWAGARERILAKYSDATVLFSPGASDEKKAGVRDRVGKALDRARGLTDVAFELEKEELTKSLKAAVQPPQGDGPHKAAMFLLVPGSSQVYSGYLDRLAKQASLGKP